MLDIVLVAATLYVCPGDVFTNQPREGCRPVKESEKEGFSRIPEAPEFTNRSTSSPKPTAEIVAPGTNSNRVPAASSQECELYDEWLRLSAKSGSLGAHELTAQEFERWSNLKQTFSVSAPPVCGSPGQ